MKVTSVKPGIFRVRTDTVLGIGTCINTSFTTKEELCREKHLFSAPKYS